MLNLFLAGPKGLLYLEKLSGHNRSWIALVIVGEETVGGVDYAELIIKRCGENKIPWLARTTCWADKLSTHFNLAISWKWMLDINNLWVLHDSTLPKYRGFSPTVAALINGETTLGATLFKAVSPDEGYDAGPILCQRSVEIHYPIRLAEAFEALIPLYLECTKFLIEKGETSALVSQDNANATYSVWNSKEDYFIDWTDSSERIVRKIHAVGPPYDYARTKFLHGIDLRVMLIEDAEVFQPLVVENPTPGKILLIHAGCPVVITGNGTVKIRSWRFEDSQNAWDKIWKMSMKIRFLGKCE